MIYPKKLIIISILFTSLTAKSQLINTVAGDGNGGCSGDGGLATAAELNRPYSSWSDGMGNIYIADFGNNRVRKVNAAGNITTIAGDGTYNHSGDTGPATAAGINAPASVVADAAGNIYIAESGSGSTTGTWIRKVNTSGVISTIAGNGRYEYSGDGGPATVAGFNDITGIAIDGAGNIYIADELNERIRKLGTDGIVTTIAGNGEKGYSGDGIPATATKINTPYGVAVDNTGNVYFTDFQNFRVRKVNTDGIITTIAGNGIPGYTYTWDGDPATVAEIYMPYGIAVDAFENVYFTDGGTNRIRKVDAAGMITTIAGTGTAGYSGDGGPATAAELRDPIGVTVDAIGDIYIADTYNLRIRAIPSTIASKQTQSTPESNNQALNAWPNPNQGAFTINVTSPVNENAQITITNMMGQKVKEIITTTNTQTQVNLETPPGLYYINAITNHGKQNEKVVMQ